MKKPVKHVRAKGFAFEREVGKILVAKLNKLFSFDPPLKYGSKKGDDWDIRRSEMSGGKFDTGDLTKSERLAKKFPFSIECKRVEGWSFDTAMNTGRLPSVLSEAYAQAQNDAPDGEMPLVLAKRSRGAIFALLEYGDKRMIPWWWGVFPRQAVKDGEKCFIIVSLDNFLRAFLREMFPGKLRVSTKKPVRATGGMVKMAEFPASKEENKNESTNV